MTALGDSMPRVVVLGAGGHAKVVLDILIVGGEAKIVGVTDPDPTLHGRRVLGIPVLGGDEILPSLRQREATHFFVGVGGAGASTARVKIFEMGRRHLSPMNVLHPRATVSTSAHLGAGIAVMAAAVVNPDATIGDGVIINTGAIVEHDCVIGDHVHVAPRATLCGGVQVGPCAHIGAGATIRQSTRIGAGAVVAAGAVVVREVEPHTVVAGVPAKILERNPCEND